MDIPSGPAAGEVMTPASTHGVPVETRRPGLTERPPETPVETQTGLLCPGRTERLITHRASPETRRPGRTKRPITHGAPPETLLEMPAAVTENSLDFTEERISAFTSKGLHRFHQMCAAYQRLMRYE